MMRANALPVTARRARRRARQQDRRARGTAERHAVADERRAGDEPHLGPRREPESRGAVMFTSPPIVIGAPGFNQLPVVAIVPPDTYMAPVALPVYVPGPALEKYSGSIASPYPAFPVASSPTAPPSPPAKPLATA